MVRPAVQGVRVGQLHEVDHLGADPEPGAAVGELVVWAVGVDLEPEEAAVELEGALEVLADDGDVVDAADADAGGDGG